VFLQQPVLERLLSAVGFGMVSFSSCFGMNFFSNGIWNEFLQYPVLELFPPKACSKMSSFSNRLWNYFFQSSALGRVPSVSCSAVGPWSWLFQNTNKTLCRWVQPAHWAICNLGYVFPIKFSSRGFANVFNANWVFVICCTYFI
jgi:hypothetical protein